VAHEHHRIDYLEFTVRDLAEARRFYSEAFGWTFTEYAPHYVGIQGSDGEVGGMRQGEPVPGGVLVVLYSDDLDASLAAVEAAGGVIVEPPFDFPGGRRFHFRDPSGHQLAVWATS